MKRSLLYQNRESLIIVIVSMLVLSILFGNSIIINLVPSLESCPLSSSSSSMIITKSTCIFRQLTYRWSFTSFIYFLLICVSISINQRSGGRIVYSNYPAITAFIALYIYSYTISNEFYIYILGNIIFILISIFTTVILLLLLLTIILILILIKY